MRRSVRVAGLLALVSLVAWSGVQVAAAADAVPLGLPPANANTTQLKRYQAVTQIELAEAQRDQLRQQVASARSSDQPWRTLLPVFATLLGVLVTAGVTYVAVILPLRNQRRKDTEERTRAAEEDVKQRRAAATEEAEQRHKELVQRFDVSFAAAVAAIADPVPAAQAGGAAALQSFLRSDLAGFHEQVYLVVRAHLDRRIDHPDAVRSILVAAFVTLLRGRHGVPTSPSTPRDASIGPLEGVNLACAWLQSADLRLLDLVSADLWRSDLRGARLDGASLRRSRAWKAELGGASLRGADLEEARFRAARCPAAVFSDARLVSARFEEAVLDKARFRGAKLQSAHFNGAKLRGADFRDADVRNALFSGATLDDDALSSLVLASGLWEADRATGRGRFTAQFDSRAADRLRVLAARRGWQWVPA